MKKKNGLKNFILNNMEILNKNNIYFSEDEIKEISFGWKKIGTTCIVNIPKNLSHKKIEIGKSLMLLDKSVSVVIQNKGIYGNLRIPTNEIIYPISSKSKNIIETIHIENKCKFKLDIYNLMFSKGNLFEKIRMINIINNNEIIVDMFAGIGYFSIPIGVHSKPKRIYSIELNPRSYYYLCENIKMNNLEKIVIPIFGDCKYNIHRGISDRVIMGYIGDDTSKYIDYAIENLKFSGGYLHYHESTPIKFFPLKQINLIKKKA